jgi:hypothetical protein
MVRVNTAKSDPPTPRSHGLARAAQRRERERADRKRERDARRRERQEQRSEEFRLHEQQGLSSPGTEEYSSSDEEEEEEEEKDRGHVLPNRWEPATPSSELAPVAGEPSPTTEAVRAAEALVRAAEPARAVDPACAWEVAGGAAAAAPTTSAGTSRKRKRAFSSLR